MQPTPPWTVIRRRDGKVATFPEMNATDFFPFNISLNFTNTTYDYYEDEDFQIGCPSFHLEIWYKYYLPVLIAIGLVGNFLAVVVFTTTHLRMRSSSYYLAALSASDFIFVTNVLVVQVSFSIFNKEGWCQALTFVSSACSTLSVWLIVAFTTERFIAIQYPLQRPRLCTVSKAKLTVILLTIGSFLVHIYVFWTTTVIDFECNLNPEFLQHMKIINLVDTLITLLIPLVMIIVMNTLIAKSVFVFRKKAEMGAFQANIYRGREKVS